ncbi:XRE family transcriptional regulator [Chengkuizengella axinellae]|uniref:XRE family transcriptional regulator n=1 Tax=Chengkuizengella axinellae TaxID=3064388 RepID=A0ABT9J3Y9_9BACL|nr:XRE family transcriptional regulator [Chengkuizengella sp. 2205SS18-9]MDP5276341.1 XRE family transcriptional regulator [Chengkuizengella sp. 2205SS18-9]
MLIGRVIKVFGLEKPRAPLGKWIDRRGIKQEWLIKKSKLGRNTITWACSDRDYMPSGKTMQKIIKALREVDPSVRADQFWDL